MQHCLMYWGVCKGCGQRVCVKVVGEGPTLEKKRATIWYYYVLSIKIHVCTKIQ
eukprot:c29675_g1_i1 orf=68-229(+)